jgi:hypothetical protein
MNNTKHNKIFILVLGALLILAPCINASNFGDTISMVRYHMKDIVSSDGGPANKYASLLFNTRTLAYLAIGIKYLAIAAPFLAAGYCVYQYRTNSPAAIARFALRNAQDTQKNIAKINAAIAQIRRNPATPGKNLTIALLEKQLATLRAQMPAVLAEDAEEVAVDHTGLLQKIKNLYMLIRRVPAGIAPVPAPIRPVFHVDDLSDYEVY